MSGLRVISFDCGNKNTGCVVIDIDKKRKHFEIVSIDHIEANDIDSMEDMIFKYIDCCIDPILRHVGKGSLILYENIFNRSLYPNWPLLRLQKKIRAHFDTQINVSVRALKPSQKAILGGSGANKKDRKQKSVTYARTFIENHGSEDMLRKFDTMVRNHDVADAILATAYVYDNIHI